MNGFFFAYTIALILVAAAAAVLALAAYAVSHRKVRLAEAGLFAFYILDIIQIFGSEWLSQNLSVDLVDYYGIENPIGRTLAGAAVLLCLWYMLLNRLDEHDERVLLVPIGVYVAACGLVVLMPYGALRQWLYYTLRQIFLAAAMVFALLRYRRSTDEQYRQRLARNKAEYMVLWVFLLLITLEDVLVILVMPEPTSADVLPLYLSSRNFSENFAMLYLAYHAIRGSLKSLSLRFEEPPAAAADAGRQENLRAHVSELLPAYAAKHGLSGREREVLGMVIEGKDNRTIAGELFLSEGTIKTHVHNIMKKTGTASRDELKKSFWAA